jgi:hypothetical protein
VQEFVPFRNDFLALMVPVLSAAFAALFSQYGIHSCAVNVNDLEEAL